MADTIAAVIPVRSDAMSRFRAGDVANAARDTGLAPGVPNTVAAHVDPPTEGLLDVADLVRMFEESESATYEARQESQRDRDYVDNKQLSAEELATLRKRGQPPQIDNRIKTKIDYLVGLEKGQRIDPKALPRTPVHEQEADAASQALRYVADEQDYDFKRSAIWRNMLVEGAGGISVAVEMGYDGEPKIVLRQWAWDRMFWDPHSSQVDFSDAGYLGGVLWMNYDDAVALYPDALDALDTTLATAPSETYDDKPKFAHWADKKRKRVRVCQMWVKKAETWHFAEFTKGGILKAGPSPYVDDKGQSDCEMLFQSAYVDRDNNRYGLVREMITLQDGINKRKSKSLHLLNTHQTTYEEGAIEDIEEYRRQKARPDGTMKVAPGALSGNGPRVISETRADLAQAHVLLLQEDKNAIDLKGPNATQMGDKGGAGGSQSASGRAIIASQQGGMISLGDLLDNLRHLDKRVFRAIWNRIRQFWSAEKWIRVTDDERNVKWVGVNIDPMKQQQLAMMAQQDPQAAEKISGLVTSVAELDCDIIIEEAPDSVTPALEQWQAIVELEKAKPGTFPVDVLIQSAPNLKDKDKLIERLNKPNPGAQMQQEVTMRGAVAKVTETENSAKLKGAQALKTMMEAHLEPQKALEEAQRARMGMAQKAQSEAQRNQQRLPSPV